MVQIFRLFWKEKKRREVKSWSIEISLRQSAHQSPCLLIYLLVLQKKTVVAENLAAKKNVIKKECAKKKTLAGCHAAWHRWQWHCDNFSYIRARISHEFVRLVGILLRWSYPFAKIGGRNFFNPWRDKFHLDDITTTK